MIEDRCHYEQHIEGHGIPVFFDSQKPANGAGESEDWPEPKTLAGDLPPVETFLLELLPPSFRPHAEDVSERMQTPLDFAGAALIVALAGCVNRRALITPKRQDTSWVVVPNLFGAMIGRPGFMKSPVLQTITAPLVKIEKGWREQYEAEEAEHEVASERAELAHQSWRDQTKQSFKKGHALPPPPVKDIQRPTRQRLLATDVTYEKLHELLSENPAGILIIRDELTGWLAGLDKLGREGERGFYLQAANGDGAFNVDRIGRGTIHVPHVCVSLFGNIQPARLRAYLSDAIVGGPTDDGLFQRFQVLVWPDTNQNWTLVDRPLNADAAAIVAKVFSTLAALPAEKPVQMHFSCKGQSLFFEWWAALESKIRGGDGLHPAMVAHLSKYRSLLPTLAGLFELADRAASNGELKDHVEINLDHTRQAAGFCDYLESHARRVYSCMVSATVSVAQELARHIKAADLPLLFTTRDVYRKHWKGLDLPDAACAALELLEDADWVKEVNMPQPADGGRRSQTWAVNPKAVRHGQK